jgi:hypothetical protein
MGRRPRAERLRRVARVAARRVYVAVAQSPLRALLELGPVLRLRRRLGRPMHGADVVEIVALLGLFVCGIAYLVLRVREHRREKARA